ncbi:Ig-like domain-containing protein [Bacillus salacetis]|uniref:Ig-like domain-containing protein n=1 Tax=Bacillus salacetis TaxID=2315464 RepID=UPI003B9DFA21
MRKSFSVFMLLILLVSTIFSNSVMAEADVSKPVFESISVDTSEVTLGDTIKVSVSAHDDYGIKDVNVYYTAPVTKKSVRVPMSYNDNAGLYEGTLTVDSSHESGIYKIEYVQVIDTSNNDTALFQHNSAEKLKSGEFTVTGTNPDVTPPVFKSINVTPKEGTVGEIINVNVKAEDDHGIKSVSVYYTTPTTEKSVPVSVSYNPETDAYEGKFQIDTSDESGVYKLNYIHIVDTSDNATSLFQHNSADELMAGEFTVSGTNPDVTSPVFESISVDGQRGTIGDTIQVSVKATDDQGIKEVYVYYSAPITKKSIYVPMKFNEENGTYEGDIYINENSELGFYEINYVHIIDTSNNARTLFLNKEAEKLAPAGFKVFRETNAPMFHSVAVDSLEAESGQYVFINVEATDDTNLNGGKLIYTSPITGTKEEVPFIYYKEKNLLQGEFYITDQTEEGQWILDSIEITDTNQNKLLVKASETNLSSGEFTVLPHVETLDARIVTSNETWSYKTINSDVYIAPGAVLTINSNVTINGNIYVLGGLRSYGGLKVTGELRASYMTFGYYYPSDGQAILSGSNSISSINISYPLFKDVPVVLYDTPIISDAGKVSITGATLPFVSAKINGQSINLNANGTFRLKDFTLGAYQNLQLELVDTQGFKHTKTFNVYDLYLKEIAKDTTLIEGKTLANKRVVLSVDGQQIAETNADEAGNFNFTVEKQSENSILVFDVLDAENQVITSKEVMIPDVTAPTKPVVNEVSDKTIEVTGTAEPNSDVYIINGSTEIANGHVSATGEFAITITKQKAGTGLEVYAVDKAGNQGESVMVNVTDKTAPAKPVVNSVSDKSTEVTGTAEPNSTVYVKKGTAELGHAVAAESREFTVSISKQTSGSELSVYAVDEAGNQGSAELVKVEDKTGPQQPQVNEVSDQSTEVTGKTEAGATVFVKVNETEIGQVIADENGDFLVAITKQKAGTDLEVYAVDKAGNQGESVKIQVIDKTGPEKPVVNSVSDKSTEVTGTAEPNSTVYVKKGTVELGHAVATETGDFAVSISKQTAGTELSVYAVDQAGNQGSAELVKVEDKTGPQQPLVNEVSDQSTEVTGKTEAGATVFVKANGTKLGQAIADENGDFLVSITKQKAGTELTVYAVDQAENQGEPSLIKVTDTTAPAKPVVNSFSNKSDKVTGTTEANATVYVKAGSAEIAKGKADSAGTFEILVEKQPAATELTIFAEDEAGNRSDSVVVVVADEIAPSQPEVLPVTDQDQKVRGTAEAGALIKVMVNNNEIGTSNADDTGDFTVEIPKQKAGTEIEITAADLAGNTSEAAKLTVKDVKPELQQLIGLTRYSTAVEVSMQGWEKSDTVLLVNGGAIADGLTATPLASAYDAPILLTKKDEIPAETLEEIQRLGASKVVLIGGTTVIFDKVEESLRTKGYSVSRLGGLTRYETSLMIAQELDKVVDVSEAYLAYGKGEPDALSIAAQSGIQKQPIILVEKKEVPKSTYDWLKAEKLSTSYFIGGTTVLEQGIISEMNRITASDVGGNRISGINRHETNAKVIEKFYTSQQYPTIMIAKSETEKLVDALSAGPLASKWGVPVLLASQKGLDDAQVSILQTKEAKRVHQIGGGINSTVIDQVLNYVND